MAQGRARCALPPSLSFLPSLLPLSGISRHCAVDELHAPGEINAMTLEPMKSALSIGNVAHTSLALPSGHQCRSGQQRVLEQVQTIRRIRSRTSSSGRTGSTSLSPTFLDVMTQSGSNYTSDTMETRLWLQRLARNAPSYDSIFAEALKSQNTSNGSLFFGNGFSQALIQEKNGNRHSVHNMKGSSVKRSAASTYQSKSYASVGSAAAPGQPNTSRSDSDLMWHRPVPQRSAPPQRMPSTRGTTTRTTTRTKRATARFVTCAPPPTVGAQPRQPPPYPVNGGGGPSRPHSQFVSSQVNLTRTTPRLNGNSGLADITMKEAVEFLSSDDETYQHCGASFIQHNTFVDDKAKEEVLKLSGVPPLVALLRSSSSRVSETASAALRNLSFKSNHSKEEVQRAGGIAAAAAALRDTDSVEIQKQLTGLLWNLSSADGLKPDLLKSALPVLMESAILPYTTGPDRTDGSSRDPEVFFNATGNLSSTKQSNRQALRKCRGLVDSLVGYVQNCVEAGTPDDKSVENCVCILHNLTFQLEAEVPVLFSRITLLAKAANTSLGPADAGPIGCFSQQSKAAAAHEQHFDFPVVEDPQPSGAGLLIHSTTLQSYLSLLETSEREETQEACCGALQNLTTHDSIVSSVMSQTIVQKLNGLQVICPLLKSKKVNMQRNTVGLVGNLTKNPNLHNAMARKALPELLGILSAGTKEGNESDDTLAMACQTSNCLLMKEPEMAKPLINKTLINSLKDLSQNGYLPKSSKAAALLLFNMWSEKDVQNLLKKQGMNKSSFVNDITTAAHRSMQVVD
ncbi:Plakophilin-1 [Liparis tanakae]|uniref:Plakophilin-1 n=1 Tax=Liparis tanakae TaxID=230148 RepID=A0A4Z2IEK2_9TELE|nr:Plakophilin-1 [Liparis tanakae]